MRMDYRIQVLIFLVVITLFGYGTHVKAEPEIIYHESLRDGELPEGWASEFIEFRTTAGGFALFEDLASNITSEEIDLQTYREVYLRFDVAKFGAGDDGPLTTYVSDDGGLTWNLLDFEQAVPEDSDYMVSGPVAVASSQLKFRWTREESPSRKRLRDIYLTGIPREAVSVPIITFLTDTSAVFTSVSDEWDEMIILERGFVIAPAAFTDNPELSDGFSLRLDSGSGAGSFSESADQLDPVTEYLIRSYAVSSNDTIYSGITGFTTLQVPPAALPYSESFDGFAFPDDTLITSYGNNNEWSFSNSTQDTAMLQYLGDWGSGIGAGFRGGAGVLGYQHTGSSGTVSITLTLQNKSGGILEDLYIAYNGLAERLTENRHPEWVVKVNGQEVPRLAFQTERFDHSRRKAVASGLGIPDGTPFTITWQSDRGHGVGASKQIGISDVEIITAVKQDIVGGAGWRMMALPNEETRVALLAHQNLVQGVTGVNAIYADSLIDYEQNVTSNILTWNYDTDSLQSYWDAIPDIDFLLMRGHGFIWYKFDNDTGYSETLPYHFGLPDQSSHSDISIDLQPGWNLVGNPFTKPLDLSTLVDWADGDIGAIAQVWDSDSGSYRLMTGDDGIAPIFQGFFIENIDASQMVFPETAVVDESPAFYKHQNQYRGNNKLTHGRQLSFENPGVLEFSLRHSLNDGTHMKDQAVRLKFHQNGTYGRDPWDISKLTPLAESFSILTFVLYDEDDIRLQAGVSRPLQLKDETEIYMQMISTEASGMAEISWNGLDRFPDAWNFILHDRFMNSFTDLRKEKSYYFEFKQNRDDNSGEIKRRYSTAMLKKEVKSIELDSDSVRFNLLIQNDPLTAESGEVPERLNLYANYPNPFNSQTIIGYDVPEEMNITIEVFDLLGRRVGTIVDEYHTPGSYRKTWNAVSHASGVYMYRLRSSDQVLVKKMTLIK